MSSTTTVHRPVLPRYAPPGIRAGAGATLFRRAFSDAKVRTIGFAYVFAIYSWLQASGYRSAYPNLHDRIAFAHSFAGNDAIRLFYGYPYSVLSVGGYSAWRVGGTLAIAAAAFGVFAVVAALRGEEDAGHSEVVLAGCVSRRTALVSSMTSILAAIGILWLAEFAGFLVGRLPPGGAAYLALSTVSVIPVFVGVGAIASQLAANRRFALALSVGTVAVFWLLRVIADTSRPAAWLRWATPLGWSESLRPFTGAQPAVLALPLAATTLMLVVAMRIAAVRDVGTGILTARDEQAARYRLLSSPLAHTLRSERAVLAIWALGIAAFGAVLGMISTSISTAGISRNMQKELSKFGSGSITTPTGYLAFVFIVFILAISLFVCSQVGAARQEESAQRLETLLANPVGRYQWLAGRLLIAAVVAAVLAFLAGLLTWAGAASQGVDISLPRVLEAGANCVPTALLFLGMAALAYAIVPRASSAVSYSLVTVSFLWYAVGALLDVPKWLVEITPFKHIGLVPTQAFETLPAIGMGVIGLLASTAALVIFRRRDLLGD